MACALMMAACGPQPGNSASASPAGSNRPSGAQESLQAWLDNGKPQEGLPRIPIYVGAHTLNAELALSMEAIQKGMMWRTNFPDTNAMLFAFGRPYQPAFWMKNVPIDIDVAYLDPEGIVVEIHRLERFNTNPVPARSANIQFALETPVDWFQRRGLGPGVLVRTDRGSLAETFLGARARR